MAILHCRSIERRRTSRAVVTIQVIVAGMQETREKFRIVTQTSSVGAHGGVVVLEAPLPVGQEFQMVNEFNRKRATGRIVSVRQGKDCKLYGAFELTCGGENFWSMSFPASGAKPMRRLSVAGRK